MPLSKLPPIQGGAEAAQSSQANDGATAAAVSTTGTLSGLPVSTCKVKLAPMERDESPKKPLKNVKHYIGELYVDQTQVLDFKGSPYHYFMSEWDEPGGRDTTLEMYVLAKTWAETISLHIPHKKPGDYLQACIAGRDFIRTFRSHKHGTVDFNQIAPLGGKLHLFHGAFEEALVHRIKSGAQTCEPSLINKVKHCVIMDFIQTRLNGDFTTISRHSVLNFASEAVDTILLDFSDITESTKKLLAQECVKEICNELAVTYAKGVDYRDFMYPNLRKAYDLAAPRAYKACEQHDLIPLQLEVNGNAGDSMNDLLKRNSIGGVVFNKADFNVYFAFNLAYIDENKDKFPRLTGPLMSYIQWEKNHHRVTPSTLD